MQNKQIDAVIALFKCDAEDAQRGLDLIDEGYTRYQAALVAGPADPDTTRRL